MAVVAPPVQLAGGAAVVVALEAVEVVLPLQIVAS